MKKVDSTYQQQSYTQEDQDLHFSFLFFRRNLLVSLYDTQVFAKVYNDKQRSYILHYHLHSAEGSMSSIIAFTTRRCKVGYPRQCVGNLTVACAFMGIFFIYLP